VAYNETMAKLKTAKQMERHLKGVANHYRIEILLLIAERNGITLEDIVETLGANEKTIIRRDLSIKNIAANSWSTPLHITEKHLFASYNHSDRRNNILINLRI